MGKPLKSTMLVAATLFLHACGDDTGTPPSSQGYTVGGSVSGLTTAGLVLANGGETVSVAANATSFTLPSMVATGAAYAVTVKTQPTHVICSVSKGSGIMGTSAVTSVAVSCVPETYTVGGTITGLGANAGLVLLNNGGDATPINAQATTFAMHTAVAPGSAYDISVGTQPYGITLNCTVSNASGTVESNVTSVMVDCSTVTPTQTAIASFISSPVSVAVDAVGNVYVAGLGDNAVLEIVAATGAVKALGSGFSGPEGVAVDTAGNVYVADTGNNAVKEIVAATGAVKTLASGFSGPEGVAVDAAGNVYVTDTGNNAVKEIVAATGAVKTVASGFSGPEGVAVDAAGNVYVADFGDGAVKEIVAATGAVKTLGSFRESFGVAVDAAGNVYVAFHAGVLEIVAATGAVNSLGSGFNRPHGVAVDTAGNVYVADTTTTRSRRSWPRLGRSRPWARFSTNLSALRWTRPAISTWPIPATTQ